MVESGNLKNLIPFNTLSDKGLARVGLAIQSVNHPAGSVICNQGDADLDVLYLASGSVEVDQEGNKAVLEAGSDQARYPFVEESPRDKTVTAISDVTVFRTGRTELERAIMLEEVTETITQLEGGDSNPLAGGDNEWLEGLKKSPSFSKLPAEKLAGMIMKLEEHKVKTSDVVVRQNDPGDYYYIVKSGTYTVSRKDGPGKTQILAQLKEGDTFGEDALVSGAKRNASIVSDGDGVLLRLSKSDFDNTVRGSLVKYVDLEGAKGLVKQGAKVLDVRLNTPDKKGGIKGAENIPIKQLRNKLDKLDKDLKYLIYCQTGNQSEVAAFIMSQRNYDVAVLKGGLQATKTE